MLLGIALITKKKALFRQNKTLVLGFLGVFLLFFLCGLKEKYQKDAQRSPLAATTNIFCLEQVSLVHETLSLNGNTCINKG